MSMATSTLMIAMTTNNSIRVNALEWGGVTTVFSLDDCVVTGLNDAFWDVSISETTT
jgi:hypothetical protein